MDDVRGYLLGQTHVTTPPAVKANKDIIISSLKSSETIQKKEVWFQSTVFNT